MSQKTGVRIVLRWQSGEIVSKAGIGGSSPPLTTVVSIDIVFNTIWVIPITSDPTIGLTTRIKNSRLFLNSYYFCILYPIPFTGNIRYCGIIDNIAEFKEVLTAVKHYYKDLLKGNNSK